MYHREPGTTTIHSNLSDPKAGAGTVALMYYIRSLDEEGSGKAIVDLEAASAVLGKSIPTIKRHLKNGRDTHGVFRSFEVSKGQAIVYYKSVIKILIDRGLDSPGVVADVDVSRLKDLKFVTTEVVTASYQQSSRFLAGKGRKEMPTADDIIETSPNCGVWADKNDQADNDETRGAILIIDRGDRFTYVPEGAPTFGVSQRYIADRLTRNERTIRRRLSNPYREERSIDSIVKTQLAAFVEKCDRAYYKFVKDQPEYEGCFWMNGAIFRVRPNVYAIDFHIRPFRRFRSLLRLSSVSLESAAAPGSPQ